MTGKTFSFINFFCNSNISDFSLFFHVKTATPLKKVTLCFLATSYKNWDPVKIIISYNLVEGSPPNRKTIVHTMYTSSTLEVYTLQIYFKHTQTYWIKKEAQYILQVYVFPKKEVSLKHILLKSKLEVTSSII